MALEDFQIEIGHLKKLHHPNIVQFFGWSEDPQKNLYLFAFLSLVLFLNFFLLFVELELIDEYIHSDGVFTRRKFEKFLRRIRTCRLAIYSWCSL